MNCDFCSSMDEKPSLLLLKEHGGKEVRIMLCRNCTVRIGRLIKRKLTNPPKGD